MHLQINDIKLSYREFGSSENQTIVFAHPMLWGSEIFGELIDKLAENYHVIAVDIHGHGKSGWRESLTLEAMTDDFAEMLDGLGCGKVIWCGISIGGMIGMRLAFKYPDRIAKLVLMSTTARLDPPDIKAATYRLWEMFRDGERESIADPAMAYFFAPATVENNPELVEKHRRLIADWKDVGGMFQAAEAAFNRTDIGAEIKNIKAPTLVIAGRDDPATPPREAEFIAAQIPGAKLEILENANHLLAIEKPTETYRLIREFLN